MPFLLQPRTFFIMLVILCVMVLGIIEESSAKKSARAFPKGFQFGSASASYQVEGAWNEDGKAEIIWDYTLHTHPNYTCDGSNGDVAADAYHHVDRDVQIMRELGLDFYRFSISWPRLLPSSFPDHVNEAGVAYYNKLINEMLKHRIQPVVTLYHWDLPQKLQEMGGWANPYIMEWYSDYARVVFQLFGDRVKHWITINEPTQICGWGYIDSLAASKKSGGIAEYICSRNLLLAHATVWYMYDEEFRHSQGGTIGMTVSAIYNIPESEIDKEAAEIASDFWWGWFLHPIFAKEGNFPPKMLKRVAEKSAAQGFRISRLQALSPEEATYVRGTADFCGLNHYSSYSYQPDDWQNTTSQWFKVVPQGFYGILTQIRKEYNNPPVYIFENGFSTKGPLVDDDRIKYMREYLSAMLDAIEEGSDVRAYTYWSMIDSFEWDTGYSVNMSDPRRPRTPRKSAFVYKHILRTRTLHFDYEPDFPAVMTIDDGR